jgi:hypothetical protein
MELLFNSVDKFAFHIVQYNVDMWWFGLDVLREI